MKLIVGDQKSIDYAALKHMEGLKIFDRHECNCDRCDFNGGVCPYCEEELEDWLSPEINHLNARAYVGLCPECNNHFLKSIGSKMMVKYEIDKIENCN